MKYEIIGSDKYSEFWSLDGHSYVSVPKSLITQLLEAERDKIVYVLQTMEADCWSNRPKEDSVAIGLANAYTYIESLTP